MPQSPQHSQDGRESRLPDQMSALKLDISQVQAEGIDSMFKPGGESRIHHSPASPVRIRQLYRELQEPSAATFDVASTTSGSRNASRAVSETSGFNFGLPSSATAYRHDRLASEPEALPDFDFSQRSKPGTPTIKLTSGDAASPNTSTTLRSQSSITRKPISAHQHVPSASTESGSSRTASSGGRDSPQSHPDLRVPRVASHSSLDLPLSPHDGSHTRGRSLTPQDFRQARNVSMGSSGRSPDRPMSYIDLMNVSYRQQVAQQNLAANKDSLLRDAVGNSAFLLDQKKTVEMYRANLKKTNDLGVQYEFAHLLLNLSHQSEAQEAANNSVQTAEHKGHISESVQYRKEARNILQRLCDRGYQYAQYYLADGYASGFFSKGRPDNDRAFPLFVAAGKHGHIEANYRAALCYEFGWGTRKDLAKAAQFLRQAASKGHPGAATRLGKACLTGDMGLGVKYKDGIRWLKRAVESADDYHNSAPYELGLMHINGYGDDVFKDEAYAAQLLTQAADLGHPEAMLRMGEAYERGLLTCPKDAALSIHFYNGAADKGLPEAMMALCAWYMVGAEPVLPKDHQEAYEWAKRAAETGLPKAEYAVGYFLEMGIGCRRDMLESNVYYVRAADQGDERAKQRLIVIREAEIGQASGSGTGTGALLSSKDNQTLKKKKSMAKPDEKDCMVM